MDFIEIAKKRYSVHLIAVQSREGLAKIGKGANLYGAPFAIIVCADYSKAWVRPFDKKQTGDIDASILTDHMMLQATELGLGSVWICYFKPDVIRREFGLPDNLEPINILAVGYSDEEAADPERPPFTDPHPGGGTGFLRNDIRDEERRGRAVLTALFHILLLILVFLIGLSPFVQPA